MVDQGRAKRYLVGGGGGGGIKKFGPFKKFSQKQTFFRKMLSIDAVEL
jgi:hypothetical protein